MAASGGQSALCGHHTLILVHTRSWCCTNILSESASADWTPWVYLVAAQGLEATPQAARTVSVSQNKGTGVEAELALKPTCGAEGRGSPVTLMSQAQQPLLSPGHAPLANLPWKSLWFPFSSLQSGVRVGV